MGVRGYGAQAPTALTTCVWKNVSVVKRPRKKVLATKSLALKIERKTYFRIFLSKMSIFLYKMAQKARHLGLNKRSKPGRSAMHILFHNMCFAHIVLGGAEGLTIRDLAGPCVSLILKPQMGPFGLLL